MSSIFKTSSEKLMNQVCRFAKKNNCYQTVTQENDVFTITVLGLTNSETEKFLKNFAKAHHLIRVPHEFYASAA